MYTIKHYEEEDMYEIIAPSGEQTGRIFTTYWEAEEVITAYENPTKSKEIG